MELFGDLARSRTKCLLTWGIYSGQKINSEAALPPRELEDFLNVLLPVQASLCKNCAGVLPKQLKDFCSENATKLE